MIAILSPAKTLDFESSNEKLEKTKARLFNHSKELLQTLREKDEEDLKTLMDISENLAMINVERFQGFSTRHTQNNSRSCILAFQGDVYQGLEADSFTNRDHAFAQSHLRILSGLYGLLRPLDAIQPYRLEMGTQLKVNGYNNLYQFWGNTITSKLNRDLKEQGDQILINLASKEYFSAINLKKLKAKVMDIQFFDFKNGEFKIISFYAKKARGMMARYIIKNQIENPNDLKGFDLGGYSFDDRRSTKQRFVFIRG